ncbi:hypothetical protein DFH08DRAFT_236486 [Mycena albidolilacea]|uniref:Uncharacterized protein n=1 Tax=Mycena albidolilacea TaxID=1033008 RepID=A0AAD6ZWH9_9AGAR|nr:hypothetical protein DFH08DRAFT_236486 [Mycena albidolilacea]
MRFNFSLAALASLATTVSVQSSSCPEAARFGNVNVSPSTLSPGETFTVTANLTCAIQKGNISTFFDYYISATATHTVAGPILIASDRHGPGHPRRVPGTGRSGYGYGSLLKFFLDP